MQPGFPLYSVEQVRAMDRTAIDRLGIPAHELMTRAASAALALLRQRWPDARRIVIACGSGNNGGDGFVLARLAQEAGLHALVTVAEEREGSTGEARRAAAEWRAESGAVALFQGALPEADLVVDALFGVGLSRPPAGAQASLIRAMAEQPAPVLALDVPSGLDADSGHAPGDVVRADATICFVAGKRGLHTGRARECTGQVELAQLGLPASLVDAFAPAARLLRPGELPGFLPPRQRTAHKGEFGHVLVAGGELGTGGAALLAAQGAARCGAGLTSLATREPHVAPALAARPELMVHALEQPAALDALLERCSVAAVGPGLGRGAWGREVLERALRSARPLVLDADALNLLAGSSRTLPPGSVLTPHPGEAARLLDTSVAAIECDRLAAAEALAARFDAVVVLKGAGSIVAAPGEVPGVIGAGNPGMASGGMGDVLTGIIAALRAQRLPAFRAACAGALLHAAAGDAAAQEGERGLLAGDLLPLLRRLANPDPA